MYDNLAVGGEGTASTLRFSRKNAGWSVPSRCWVTAFRHILHAESIVVYILRPSCRCHILFRRAGFFSIQPKSGLVSPCN